MRFAVAIFLVHFLVLSGVVGAAPPPAAAIDSSVNMPTTVERVGGADRFDVAINLAGRYSAGVPVVYIAKGTDFPDALSAAPAAAFEGGPLLLTAPGALPVKVQAELKRLRPAKIVVVGGVSSVSEGQFRQLATLAPVIHRIGGADRYEASRKLADYAFGASGASRVYLATGQNFPDALAASAVAGSRGGAVILVPGFRTTLDTETVALIEKLHPDDVVIAGGPASVSTGVASAVTAMSLSKGSFRLGGSDRFDAAVNINREAHSDAEVVFIATGYNYPDALAGAVRAGKEKSPLFLVGGSCMSQGVHDEIRALDPSKLVILGGPTSVTRAVEDLAICGNAPAGPRPTEPAPVPPVEPRSQQLYIPQNTSAARAALDHRRHGRTTEAALIDQIASQPTAVWLGDWYSPSQLRETVSAHLSAARLEGTTPVFVTYAIPNRDCGGYSAGGLSPTAYGAWNQALADSLRGQDAIVIVEPDALALLDSCPEEVAQRTPLLYNATKTLANAGAIVYLDAGHSNWVSPEVMVQRLWDSGLEFARGFSTNVSNYYLTSAEQAYAEQIRVRSGKNYVIDVSRNGVGSTGEWCNAPGAGLGEDPRLVSDDSGLDALLWIKLPGESDGSCNGAPAAGQWFDSYAQDLARNRG